MGIPRRYSQWQSAAYALAPAQARSNERCPTLSTRVFQNPQHANQFTAVAKWMVDQCAAGKSGIAGACCANREWGGAGHAGVPKEPCIRQPTQHWEARCHQHLETHACVGALRHQEEPRCRTVAEACGSRNRFAEPNDGGHGRSRADDKNSGTYSSQ